MTTDRTLLRWLQSIRALKIGMCDAGTGLKLKFSSTVKFGQEVDET